LRRLDQEVVIEGRRAGEVRVVREGDQADQVIGPTPDEPGERLAGDIEPGVGAAVGVGKVLTRHA
jgi:hypothetical protein